MHNVHWFSGIRDYTQMLILSLSISDVFMSRGDDMDKSVKGSSNIFRSQGQSLTRSVRVKALIVM